MYDDENCSVLNVPKEMNLSDYTYMENIIKFIAS